MKILRTIYASSAVPYDTEYKFVAKTWNEVVRKLKTQCGIDVDSAYARKYEQFIIGYGLDGSEYEIEVNKYYDGSYEVLFNNINPTGN